MSDDSQDEDVKIEIQKLLITINADMIKLKSELSSLQDLIEENASLPTIARLANEKLIIAAKEAGIDLENLEELQVSNDSDEGRGQKASGGKKKTNSKSRSAKTDAEIVATAAEELTKKVKRTLRK